jgi:hypothetical protein
LGFYCLTAQAARLGTNKFDICSSTLYLDKDR